MSPQRDPPLNDAECARMDAMLARFRSEYAMNNREEIDGFFAALICSPDIAKPSEYLPEIWGGEMTYDEAFVDREQLLDFLGLLMRHWDSIVRILHEEDVFAPLLFHGEGGIAHANDWARGFMRGVRLDYKSIDVERREKLTLGIATGVIAISMKSVRETNFRPVVISSKELGGGASNCKDRVGQFRMVVWRCVKPGTSSLS